MTRASSPPGQDAHGDRQDRSDTKLPDDAVFTEESSIRSTQSAVYTLLGLNLERPAVYQGKLDPRVLYKAFHALHEVQS